MILRAARAMDIPAIADLFHDAVMRGAAPAYDARQRAAWAGPAPDPERMEGRLAGLEVIVAEDAEQLIGFASLGPPTGLMDHLFVAPDRRGTGLAGALVDEIVRMARARGLTRLHTEASLLARPFLLRRGWREDAAQTVRRDGVDLRNFRMSIDLPPASS